MENDSKAYWRDVPADAKHGFLAYAKLDKSLAAEMFFDLLRICEPSDSFLEIGCNAGTNFEYLRGMGFSRFTGIEINPRAIEHFRKTYPETYAKTSTFVGDALPIMRGLPDGGFDVVFTKGCLVSIPHSDDEIFSHITRVARRAVLIREPDPIGGKGVRFARDYERVFSDLGFQMILKKLHYKGRWGNLDPDRPNNNWLRLFVRGPVSAAPY